MEKLLKNIRFKITAIFASCLAVTAYAQLNTDQIMNVGRNALYFEDYMLSIQYFNKVIEVKPYLAQPYFFRSIAKLNLEDYRGAEEDASLAIERNPFISDAYEVRGVARQNLGKIAEAITDYDKALEQLPNNKGLLFNKALAQEELGQLDEAQATYANIISAWPGYDNAYAGRARLYLQRGDTISARSDLDHTLLINPNNLNAHVMRAELSIKADNDYTAALADLDDAIKLQPRQAGLYINRAFLRYKLDDYFGAMSDYDYALTLDPLNAVAYFNRGLLRAEVSDNDKAIVDFTRVLQLQPSDTRALYNRAMIYYAKQDYANALADLETVIAEYPEMSGLEFTRFDILDKMGNRQAAIRSYDRARSLARTESQKHSDGKNTGSEGEQSTSAPLVADDVNDKREDIASRFSTLLTIDNQLTDERAYNNKNIRGKVQDRDVNITLLPDFYISMYVQPTELNPETYYIAALASINASMTLTSRLSLVNEVPVVEDEEDIHRHFESIARYTTLINEGNPRGIDFFGRGMEYFTVRDYQSAVRDFTRSLELAPDFSLALLMRAESNLRLLQLDSTDTDSTLRRAIQATVLADMQAYSTITPDDPFIYYNIGNYHAHGNELTEALVSYDKAIKLKPDFGEAYYNRGYVHFKLGNKEAGTADMSKAGQLGIVPSYNLLKRMNR